MTSATANCPPGDARSPDPEGCQPSLHRQLAALLRCSVPPGPPNAAAASAAGPSDLSPQPWNAQQWEQVTALTRSERLDSLLYVALLAAQRLHEPPAAIRAELEAAYWRTKVANLLAWNAVNQIGAACCAVQVPVVLLKGAALAFTLYGDPARRPLGDLDILVREQDVAKTRRVLHLLGYTPAPDVNEDHRPPDPHRTPANTPLGGSARRLGRSAEITYVRGGKLPTQVDLHWGLSGHTTLRRSLDPTWFWQHVRPLSGCEDGLLVWDNEAQFLHLCAHTLQHGRPRLRWTYDIALLLGQCSLAWDLVLTVAEASGLVLAVQDALAAVALLWGVAPPPAVVVRLGALGVTPGERRMQRLTSAGDLRALAACDLLARRNLTSALDVWLAAAFPPRGYMRSRYGLADDHMLPALYLYRAVFGTAGSAWRACRVLCGRSTRPPGQHNL